MDVVTGIDQILRPSVTGCNNCLLHTDECVCVEVGGGAIVRTV